MKKGLLFTGLCMLVSSMFIFTACDDDDDEIKIEPVLSLAETSHVFANEEGDYALAIFANGAWTLTQEGDWFKVDKTSGNGNAAVKVTATENTTDGERSGKITVKSEGLADQVLQVSQKKEDVVLKVLGEDSYLIKPEGGAMKITVEANVSYTYEMTEWVKVSQGYDASRSDITLNIEPNFWGITREATVVIKNAKDQKVVKEIKLTQESVVAEITERISFDGKGEKAVTIALDGDMSWTLDEGYMTSAPWLTCSQLDNEIIVVAEQNDDPQRYVLLLLENEETGFRKTILVEQEPYSAITMDLSTDPGTSGTSNVDIEATSEEYAYYRYVKNLSSHIVNVVVSAEDAEWIHPSLDKNTMTISLDKNEGEAREGDVIVIGTDADGRELIVKEIHVKQAKEVVEPYIRLSATEHVFTFGNSGETFVVTVDANVEWEISKDGDNGQLSYVVDGDVITITYTQLGGPIMYPFEYNVHRKGMTATSDNLNQKISVMTTRP
ncbi:BACON domain-containing protein [uncultured Butyricimonas sp.]|uniref:BACON domain-containing protein n=1 Tax=uncultured Butyricimonas sp. TaxID=1268785 RepID=UPI0026DB662B|nr:BACON domain-containing protein [uncultured Butyricimonas sp.]